MPYNPPPIKKNGALKRKAKEFFEAEEHGEVVLPMATRPHYASILNEDWDPLDFVGRLSNR